MKSIILSLIAINVLGLSGASTIVGDQFIAQQPSTSLVPPPPPPTETLEAAMKAAMIEMAKTGDQIMKQFDHDGNQMYRREIKLDGWIITLQLDSEADWQEVDKEIWSLVVDFRMEKRIKGRSE